MRSLSLLVLLLATSAAAQIPAPPLADEAALRILEDQERIALLHADTSALAVLWHEAVTLDLPGRPVVRGRARALVLVAQGALRHRQVVWRVDRVDLAGNVAVASGEETMYPAGLLPGAPSAAARFMHRWVREGSRWRLASVYVAGPSARAPVRR